jgi:hypothetical protein
MYQRQYPEFSGMTNNAAMQHWTENYSQSFFAAWQQSIDRQKGNELLSKMGWAEVILTTIPLEAAISATATNLKLGRLSPRTVSLPANRAANSMTNGSVQYTKTAEKHLTEVVIHRENAGRLSRPYMKSPLTIQEIMSTGQGVPDATFPGGLNWRASGTFRGSQGIWELGINPETNTIYHFVFK